MSTYNKYVSDEPFGIVSSLQSNISLSVTSTISNQRLIAICPALQNIFIWDVKRQEKIACLSGEKHQVTAISFKKETSFLSVGYNDGAIRLWNMESNEPKLMCTLTGHKSRITCLEFDKTGFTHVSGSTDNDVVVWSVLEERPISRLRGHTAPITSCKVMKNYNVCLSSSKDATIKIWDLDLFVCFATLVGNKNDIIDIALLCEENYLIACSQEKELKFWKITANVDDMPETDSSIPFRCNFSGIYSRIGSELPMRMETDSFGKYVFLQTKNCVEVYKFLSLQKVLKHFKTKKIKSITSEDDININDQMVFLKSLRFSNKLKTFNVCFRQSIRQMMLLFSNNTMSVENLILKKENGRIVDVSTSTFVNFDNVGHQLDPRCVCFNNDGNYFVSGSADSIKIWNTNSFKCLNTFTDQNLFCTAIVFVPGDRHIVAACKDGSLRIFELASGLMTEKIPAHSKVVWSLIISPDKLSIASGSADHEVKIWEFIFVISSTDEIQRKTLSLNHARTLQLSDEVLSVRYSPNGKFIAAALLDSTIKIFFADTFKFFLSLYGHKLPVMCLDISWDSVLIISGSADKNVKIWGMDFGDCHKSIFSHDDSITFVKFLPKSHLYFTASRDGKIRHWNADSYEMIMTLEGHFAEVWSLDVTSDGQTLVSCSHDRSLRVWRQSEDMVIVDAEQNEEAEEEYEKELLKSLRPPATNEPDADPGVYGVSTVQSLKYSEAFIDALEDYEKEMQLKSSSGNSYEPSLIFQSFNVSPERYVLDVLQKTRSCDLEEALILLPYSHILVTLRLCDFWLQENMELFLIIRVVVFLTKLHYNQLRNDENLYPLINRVKINFSKKLAESKQIIGTNIAGVKFLKLLLEKNQTKFYEDALRKRKSKTTLAAVKKQTKMFL